MRNCDVAKVEDHKKIRSLVRRTEIGEDAGSDVTKGEKPVAK